VKPALFGLLCVWRWAHFSRQQKLRLCLGFQALSRSFCRAHGKNNLCRAPLSAQQYSRQCNLCWGSSRRQAGTLGIIKSLPRASARHGVHRRRRSERHHIWAAVHCADGSAVGPSAYMPPMPSVVTQLSAKELTRGYPGWLSFAESLLWPSAEHTSVPTTHARHNNLCRGPHRALGKEVIFLLNFGSSFFFAKATLVRAWFPILVFFEKFLLYSMYFRLFLNFSTYFKFEQQVLKIVNVYDWKIDIVAC
jgi:hypothetical protein